MAKKPTYEELEQRVKELENETVKRKLAEEELRIKDSAIASSINAIALADLDGNLTYVNRSFLDMWGYDDEKEVLGRSALSFWEVEEKAAEVARVSLTSGNWAGDLVAKRKDGSTSFVQLSANLVSDDYGRPICQMASFMDVTERKKAEEALRESENIFSLFMEHNPIYVFFKDENIRSIRLSRNYEQMLGRPIDELLGKTMDELFPADLAKSMIADDLRILNEGNPVTVEEELNGRFYETTKFPILINGKPKYLAGYTIDITDRKQTEEALRESEEKFRSFMETANDLMHISDKDGYFTYVNESMAMSLGYTKEEMIGMHINKILGIENYTKESFEKNVKSLLMKLAKEGEITLETHYVTKDGRKIQGERKVIPIYDRDSEYAGSRVIFHDLTKRKRAEKEKESLQDKLQRSQKMESMGLLAGGVAHDLNNVLSGIVSYPDLLLLNLPEDSKLRKPIETIQESGHRAAAIVQDLLTVARGVATTKGSLNLNDLIGDYLKSPEFQKLEYFHPTVTVKTNLDSDLLNVIGSHVHIRKMVMNLVSNASEAIEGSGNVNISTMNRYIDRPLRGYDDVNIGEYAVLAVSDDGSGISSDDLERIFEPFYTKKVMGRSGTGLGLAVVWNVVQDHKGYIDVKSDENGTTFELYFPITREEISVKDLSIPIEDLKGDGETILVVDDMESQRYISCKMLDTLGYKTKAVSGGEEAVEYLKENSVDLLLLDMIMDPGINGRETYERIIKIHPRQKAIIVSGFAETEDVKEAEKLGVGIYIKKPLTLEKIGLAIKEELEK